jgi:hydroxypyruvate isomerase
VKHTLSIKFMWPELPLAERVRAAARDGFDGVELWDWRGEDIDGCSVACRETGTELTAFFGHSRGGLADPDQIAELEAALAESIDVAQRVDARQLFIFSDELSPDGEIRRQPPPLIRARRMRAMVDGLRRCARLVEGTRIELVVEAINTFSVPGYFLSDTGDAIMLVREVDHPNVRLVIDCFHHQMSEGRLVDHLVEGLPYLAAIHISDVPDRRPPGMGEINFQAVRQALAEHNFDGQLTFEIVPVNGDSEGAVAAIKAAFPF